MVIIKSKVKVESKRMYETYHITGILDDIEFCVEFVPNLEIWNDIKHNLKGGVDIRKIKQHYFEQCIKYNNEGTPFYWEQD